MNTPTHQRHDALYLRVSTVDRQDTASQAADLERYAAGSDLACLTYEDHATGAVMQRPAFDRLLLAARRGLVRRLVVWRLDRLGRTAAGLTSLFDELVRLGVVLVSVRDGFDLSTAGGRLLANVLASVAQFERELIAERIAAGIAAAREKGRKWGGSRPGWMSARVQRVSQAARDLAAAGHSGAAIARQLGLSWRTVRKILETSAHENGGVPEPPPPHSSVIDRRLLH